MQDTSFFENWFISSKIEPERPNIPLVERRRLTNSLSDVLEKSLILVVAPAGFGKSTLISQWRAALLEEQVLCPWLSLDENDFEGRQFLSYLVLSLAEAGFDLNELSIGAKNGFADSSEKIILRRLLAEIELADSPCVLFLDDYHRASSPSIDALVAQLIRETPPSFTILLASRSQPDLDCATLLATGAAAELGPDSLRLTKEEAQMAIGPVQDQAFSAIYEKTEGWPVAVQLARVRSDGLNTIPATGPGHPSSIIASYLTEQVVNSLEEDSQKFLLSTSVFKRFSADLLNYVFEIPDAWSNMLKLDQLSAFIIPMDREGNWYRYHHLFSDYLFDWLRKTNTELVTHLCARASDWHWQNGQPLEAVDYAAQIRDFDRCAEIINALGGWQIIVGQGIGFMRKLLRFMPDEELKNHPRVALSRTYLHCKDGELKEARFLYDNISWANRDCTDEDWLQDHLLVGQLLGIYQDIIIDAAALEGYVDDAKTRLPGLNSLSIGTLRCMEVNSCFANANIGSADACLEDASQLMRQGGSALGLNYCYIHACVHALYRADFSAATSQAKLAYDEAENNFGADSGLKYIANTLRFGLDVWSGRATEADLQSFVGSLKDLEEHDGWTEVYLVGLDAGYHLAASFDDWGTAYAIVDCYQHVASVRDLGRLKLFCSTLKLEAARHGGLGPDVDAPTGKILALVSDFEDTGDWYCRLVAATKLFSLGLISDHKAAEVYRANQAWAESRGLYFHSVRLVASRTEFYLATEDEAALVPALSDLVDQCAQFDFFWPFKINTDLKMALYKHRDDLGLASEGLNKAFVDKFLSGQFEQEQPKGANTLSMRERQVLSCLAEGLSNKLIARELDLTDNTVKFHLKNIFMKLSVSRRGAAVFEARRKGLI